MPELIAKPALPPRALTLGGCTLSLADPGPITSIALFPGQEKPANKALKPLGLVFPAPNRVVEKAGVMLAWTARDQAFLIGAAPPDMGASAALSDQSGGWAGLLLQGGDAWQVLARHVPIDLRDTAFPAGSCARAPLNHMQSVILRRPDAAFLVLVFRSMARSAWHEIETAMQAVAARGK